MQSKENRTQKTIEELERKIKRDRIIKIIIIIIIIILLLLWWLLGYKMGKIGYDTDETYVYPTDTEDSEDVESEIAIINITDNDVSWDKDTEVDIFSNEKFNRRRNNSSRFLWNL